MSRIGALLRRLLGGAERRPAGERLLELFAAVYPRACFVEIGANDGERYDHLAPFLAASGWRGIMVEPVPYVFDRLAASYRSNPRVILEPAAIAESNGRLPFYHLREAEAGESIPDWYDGLGSLSRETVLDHVRDIPDVADRLVETTVPALTFDTLLEKHSIDAVDLVLVDTEGYDARLLAAIDLERWRPRLIVYEHFHLGPDQQAETRRRLESLGYASLEEGFDTWSVDVTVSDRLARGARRIRPAVRALFAYDEDRAAPRHGPG